MDDYFAPDEGGNTEFTEEPGEITDGPSTSAVIDKGATLTLAALEPLTGISYVTLQRYAQKYGDRLPHEGDGRNRRYYPEAIEEFQKIREEQRGGGSRSMNMGHPMDAGGAAGALPKKGRKKTIKKTTAKKGTMKKATGTPVKGGAKKTPQPQPPMMTKAPTAPQPDQLMAAFQKARSAIRDNIIDELIAILTDSKKR